MLYISDLQVKIFLSITTFFIVDIPIYYIRVRAKKYPLPKDNKIRYRFYRNSPPPSIMVGAIAKIVRVSRVAVDYPFIPPTILE